MTEVTYNDMMRAVKKEAKKIKAMEAKKCKTAKAKKN